VSSRFSKQKRRQGGKKKMTKAGSSKEGETQVERGGKGNIRRNRAVVKANDTEKQEKTERI